VDRGYFAAQGLARDPLLAPLRDEPAFAEVLSRAERGRAEALAAFRAAGGDALLAL